MAPAHGGRRRLFGCLFDVGRRPRRRRQRAVPLGFQGDSPIGRNARGHLPGTGRLPVGFAGVAALLPFGGQRLGPHGAQRHARPPHPLFLGRGLGTIVCFGHRWRQARLERQGIACGGRRPAWHCHGQTRQTVLRQGVAHRRSAAGRHDLRLDQIGRPALAPTRKRPAQRQSGRCLGFAGRGFRLCGRGFRIVGRLRFLGRLVLAALSARTFGRLGGQRRCLGRRHLDRSPRSGQLLGTRGPRIVFRRPRFARPFTPTRRKVAERIVRRATRRRVRRPFGCRIGPRRAAAAQHDRHPEGRDYQELPLISPFDHDSHPLVISSCGCDPWGRFATCRVSGRLKTCPTGFRNTYFLEPATVLIVGPAHRLVAADRRVRQAEDAGHALKRPVILAITLLALTHLSSATNTRSPGKTW